MTSSDIVQLVSFPLEIIGVTITILENIQESKRQALEAELLYRVQKVSSFFDKFPRLMFALFSLFFIIVIIDSIIFNTEYLQSLRATIEILLVLGTMLIVGLIVFSTMLQILPKRQLLAFGLSLSTAGIYGEFYQIRQINF